VFAGVRACCLIGNVCDFFRQSALQPAPTTTANYRQHRRIVVAVLLALLCRSGSLGLRWLLACFGSLVPPWGFVGSAAGHIPTEIGLLAQLQFLRAYDNQLSGAFVRVSRVRCCCCGCSSDGAGGGYCGGVVVQRGVLLLDVCVRVSTHAHAHACLHGKNASAGAVPTEIGNLGRLQWLQLYRNRLTGACACGTPFVRSTYVRTCVRAPRQAAGSEETRFVFPRDASTRRQCCAGVASSTAAGTRLLECRGRTRRRVPSHRSPGPQLQL
jgi:hypothetical protein